MINFWEAQRKARARTTVYLCIFIILTVVVAVIAELTLRAVAEESYHPPIPFLGLAFLGITFIVALYNYLMYRQHGGGYVAESLGAYRVDQNGSSLQERQLYNIVRELSLATSLPMPAVYILPANEINAFAAGLRPDQAAIAITEGALQQLNREEVQGVLAHEFGHIANGDSVISLRLAAMVMGFFFVLYLGLRLLEGSSYRSRRDNGKGGNPILLTAVILMIAGALAWLMGTVLKAMVSRQREYLADASAVQFTRNPDGLINALKKIEKEATHDMPKTGSAYSHMYLEDHDSWLATHPPIRKRIAVLQGHDKA